ncbi:MAG: sterol desaturase [Waterburya sp.]
MAISYRHFFYHVPEHVFGKFHTLVHHGKNRSFIFVPFGWQISPVGTILSLILGEIHVIWRHVSIINWQTPRAIAFCCQIFFITTPERHWQHHQNANLAYGDIFTFFDAPAIAWMQFLLVIKKKYRQLSKKPIT